MSSQADVEAELAALKGSTPQAIDAPRSEPHPGRGGQRRQDRGPDREKEQQP